MLRRLIPWLRRWRGLWSRPQPDRKADFAFREFFIRIAQLERTPPRLETKSEPQSKARVTLLAPDSVRRP